MRGGNYLYGMDITDEDARQQRLAREAAEIEEAWRCKCRRPLIERKYLNHEFCKLCQKLRY